MTTTSPPLRVVVLGTGGTISSVASSSGASPARTAKELAMVAGVGENLDVEARDVFLLPSHAISPADMWRLAEAVVEAIAAGAAGIIVTHGTDTLEETAYALSLLVDRRVPIVMTGAMRPAGAPGSDGPANMAAALRVASDPRSAQYGPLLVHQDEIHMARWVTKMFTTRVAAFASPVGGPVGYLVENRVRFSAGPPQQPETLLAIAPPSTRVEVVHAYTGADGAVIASIASVVDGLVIAGTGGGHAPPAMASAIHDVVTSGIPVVMSSRCAGGVTLTSSYGGPGTERHLREIGVLSAGDLSPAKARLRLLFGLSAGLDPASLFDTQLGLTTPEVLMAARDMRNAPSGTPMKNNVNERTNTQQAAA